MGRIISKRDKKSSKLVTEWDKAITDAKLGIKRLVIAIQDFEEKKAAGEPWPGSAAAQSNRHPHEPQHSV
jgi:hypothetical protein